MLTLLINGENSQQIHVLDRGFQYGDGLFETILFEEGCAIFLDEHLSRLESGCHKLGFGLLDKSLIENEIKDLVDGATYGIIKIILSRGIGERGFQAPTKPKLTRIISFEDKPDSVLKYQTNITLGVCKTRLSRQPQLAGIKHLSQIERVLARSEWTDSSINECLMLDTEGLVIEGTMSNLFIVKKGVLKTPELNQCGINGIIRNAILVAAEKQNKQLEITSLGLVDILQADEIFMTNSLMPIWGVASLISDDNNVKYSAGELTNWAVGIVNNEIIRQSKEAL